MTFNPKLEVKNKETSFAKSKKKSKVSFAKDKITNYKLEYEKILEKLIEKEKFILKLNGEYSTQLINSSVYSLISFGMIFIRLTQMKRKRKRYKQDWM